MAGTIPIEEIYVDREARQRGRLRQIDELAQSLSEIGLINPIVVNSVDGFLTLVAGERRLEAAKRLGWTDVPVTYLQDLDPSQARIIELEENIKREDLSWQEAVRAIYALHKEFVDYYGEEEWTQERTAQRVSIDSSWITHYIRVGRAMEKGDERVINASTFGAALNICKRMQERAVENELDNLDPASFLGGGDGSEDNSDETVAASEAVPPHSSGHSAAHSPAGLDEVGQPDQTAAGVERQPASPTTPREVIQQDFLAWEPERRFNLLHCDFPYGISHQQSGQGNVAHYDSYEDDPEVYWRLLESLLDRKDEILYPSCHILFWFSMPYYQVTVDKFEAAGFVVDPVPFIWHKSDNKGIIPDPERGPRRAYETALFIRRGDRKIVQPKANLYAASTSKEHHVSEKPESVLRHFFGMLVDENTEMLDPTCGSGTSLRAADALGASIVRGMDLNQEHVDFSQSKLDRQRKISQAAKQTAE